MQLSFSFDIKAHVSCICRDVFLFPMRLVTKTLLGLLSNVRTHCGHRGIFGTTYQLKIWWHAYFPQLPIEVLHQKKKKKIVRAGKAFSYRPSLKPMTGQL